MIRKLFLAFASFVVLALPGLALDYPGYPPSAEPVFVPSTNASNAQLQIALPAVVGRTNFLTSIMCTSNGATAASFVSATIAGLMGGTRTYVVFVPANTSGGNNVVLDAGGAVSALLPVPASAANTAITFTLPALGAGNTLTHCTIAGFHTRPPN